MRFRILGLAVASLALVASCSRSPAPAPPDTVTADFPVTVGTLTLDKRPERIVSFSSTATEMLFAIDAGAQVVAVDDNSNYPPQAPKTTLSAFKPNAEAIATYRPDLVVLSYDMDKIVDQLRVLRIATFLVPPAENLADTYRKILELGALTGHRQPAQALIERMRVDIDGLVRAVPTRAKPLTYYYELDQAFFSVTSRTFVGALLGSIGLVNIADAGNESNPYPQLSAEVIVKADPDLIFLADTKCCGQSATTVAARPGWSGLKAVRTGQVVGLDDDIASRWGPRVVDLLRAAIAAVATVPQT